MRDKETREDIEDIKEASKSRDFFDILRKRQRRNVMTEAYRETEQAENAFFEERAQKHETEGLLDRPILKKSFITGIFLIILVALIVLAVVFFMQERADVEIKFICTPDNQSNITILYCNTTVIPKSNLTNVDFCLYYDTAFNFPENLKCNFKYDIFFSGRNKRPFCFVGENISANQKYICSVELTRKPNQTANSNNLFEVCYIKDSGKVCVKKNQE